VTGGELRASIGFLVAAAAAVALAAVYWEGGQPQAEGVLLAAALGGIGVGVVTWARSLEPGEGVVEERGSLVSREVDVQSLAQDLEDATPDLPAHSGRRRLLIGSAAAAGTALGVALLFPVRSLGPRPGRGLKRTGFAGRPRRVVSAEGRPLRPGDLPVDGVVTAFPEGHAGAAGCG